MIQFTFDIDKFIVGGCTVNGYDRYTATFTEYFIPSEYSEEIDEVKKMGSVSYNMFDDGSIHFSIVTYN